MRCLSLPLQCLIPVLRNSSLGSSFMLVLLPSQPCSPNNSFAGERERLIGLEGNAAEFSIKELLPCSSLISFNFLGEGVRFPRVIRFDDSLWPHWRSSPTFSPSLRESNFLFHIGEVRKTGDRNW